MIETFRNFFQNKEIGSVAILDFGLIILGLIVILTTGDFFGILLAASGALLIAYGWNNLPADPLTEGVVTKGGRVIYRKIGDNERCTYTVKGIFLTVPPFIDVIKIKMTNQELKFDKEVLSVETGTTGNDKNKKSLNVPLKGSISLTICPDPDDMYDFIKAGGNDMDAKGISTKIKEQLDDIIFREVQRIITDTPDPDKPSTNNKGLSAKTIVQKGHIISELLTKSVNGTKKDDTQRPLLGPYRNAGILEQKDFGIICTKAQVNFPLPDDVREAMIDGMQTEYDSAARQLEYDADLKAIDEYRTKLKLTPEEAVEMFRQSRLIRDGKMSERVINIKGKGGVVNFFGGVSDEDEKRGSKEKGKK